MSISTWVRWRCTTWRCRTHSCPTISMSNMRRRKNISTLQVQNSDNFTLNESAAEENEEAEHPEVDMLDRVVEEVLVVGPLGAGGVAGVKRQY